MKAAFAQYCVQMYTKERWKGSTQAEDFRSDFEPLTVETFAVIDSTNQSRLCKVLSGKGMYMEEKKVNEQLNFFIMRSRASFPGLKMMMTTPLLEKTTAHLNFYFAK